VEEPGAEVILPEPGSVKKQIPIIAMNYINNIATVLAVFLATSSAWAAVTPVLIGLTVGVTGQTSYTVPSGKVLIINHVQIAGAGLSAPIIQIGMPVLNAPLFIDTPVKIGDGSLDSSRLYPISPPIRLGGSPARLTIPPAMSSGSVYFWGLLIDSADLYAAAIPLELQNPGVSEGRLFADAKVSSPRPRVLMVETSDDLVSFGTEGTSRITGTQDPSRAVVSVEASGDKKFMRARASARTEEK